MINTDLLNRFKNESDAEVRGITLRLLLILPLVKLDVAALKRFVIFYFYSKLIRVVP